MEIGLIGQETDTIRGSGPLTRELTGVELANYIYKRYREMKPPLISRMFVVLVSLFVLTASGAYAAGINEQKCTADGGEVYTNKAGQTKCYAEATKCKDEGGKVYANSQTGNLACFANYTKCNNTGGQVFTNNAGTMACFTEAAACKAEGGEVYTVSSTGNLACYADYTKCKDAGGMAYTTSTDHLACSPKCISPNRPKGCGQ